MKILRVRSFNESKLYYILLALFCMNFMGRGSVVCLVFGVYALWVLPQKYVLDLDFFFSMLLSVGIFLASLMYYGLEDMIRSVNFALMYIVGRNSCKMASNKIEFIKKSMGSIFAGYALYLLFTYLFNPENLALGYRSLDSFWTGEPVSVTLIGLMCSVPIGYCFYGVVCQKNRWIKLFAVLAVVIGLVINVQTSTRTPIVLLPCVLVATTLVYLANQSVKKMFMGIVVVVLLFLALFTLYSLDVFGIRTYILLSPLYERFLTGGLQTSRVDIIFDYLSHMIDYPFGGGNIAQLTGMGAHIYILEAHDDYGFLATIALVGITCSAIKNIISLLCIKKRAEDYLFFSMYLAVLVQMCLEPVFSGYPALVYTMIYMHGIINGYVRDRKKGLITV